jgi:hypothetical protein
MDSYTSKYGFTVTILFFGLSFYSIGAGMMDSFVLYHSWQFVGENEFAFFHKEAGQRIVLVFVLPMLLLTVLIILSFWHRHVAISRKLLGCSLLFISIGWLSSFVIQIPIQIELDKGKNSALLNQLIVTDWIRVIASWGLALTTIAMLRRSIKGNGPNTSK